MSVLVFSRIETSLVEWRQQFLRRLERGSYINAGEVERELDRMGREVVEDINAYSVKLGLGFDVPYEIANSVVAAAGHRLRHSLDDLSEAVKKAKEAGVPDSTLESVMDRIEAGFGGTHAQRGGEVGALFGPFGIAVGRGLGGFIDWRNRDAEVGSIHDEYNQAAETLVAQIDAIEMPVYGLIQEHLQRHSGLELLNRQQLHPIISGLQGRLQRGTEQAADDKSRALQTFSGGGGVDRFYGPLVSRWLLTFAAVCEIESETQSLPTKHLEALADMFYYDADVLEGLADTHLAVGDAERALTLIEEVIGLGEDGDGVRYTEAEAHYALGHFSAAEQVLRRMLQRDGYRVQLWKRLADCLVEMDRADDAAEEIAEATGLFFTGGQLARIFAEGPASVLLERDRLRLYARPDAGKLQQLVAECFTPDDECVIYRSSSSLPTTGHKLNNAKSTYLNLRPAERPLALFDTTVWGSAKNGATITSERLLWKGLWEEPHEVTLADFPLVALSEGGVILTDAVGPCTAEDASKVIQQASEDPSSSAEFAMVDCPEAHRPGMCRFLNVLSRFV